MQKNYVPLFEEYIAEISSNTLYKAKQKLYQKNGLLTGKRDRDNEFYDANSYMQDYYNSTTDNRYDNIVNTDWVRIYRDNEGDFMVRVLREQDDYIFYRIEDMRRGLSYPITIRKTPDEVIVECSVPQNKIAKPATFVELLKAFKANSGVKMPKAILNAIFTDLKANIPNAKIDNVDLMCTAFNKGEIPLMNDEEFEELNKNKIDKKAKEFIDKEREELELMKGQSPINVVHDDENPGDVDNNIDDKPVQPMGPFKKFVNKFRWN